MINITKEMILEYESQGLKIPAIAQKLNCDKHLLYRIKKGMVQKIDTCQVCGKEFVYTGKAKRVSCGKTACLRVLMKHKDLTPGQSPVRPFSDTTNMMIILKLDEGMSAAEIAQIFGREINHVKQQINKLLTDGTADQIRRRVNSHQEYNKFVGGVGIR